MISDITKLLIGQELDIQREILKRNQDALRCLQNQIKSLQSAIGIDEFRIAALEKDLIEGGPVTGQPPSPTQLNFSDTVAQAFTTTATDALNTRTL